MVEMASIDEAYLDMTGTERLHGPPLRAAHLLHERMKADTGLNCSIGISASRMVAKICSDQAKPNGVLWVIPGQEAAFLAPLDVRRVPGVGKVTEKNLHTLGIRKVGDLARLDEKFLAERFGKWGLALAGKSRGLDAGGWFDSEIGADEGPKSISHEHTFSEDTADLARIEVHAGAPVRDGGPAAARARPARPHGATQAALFGFFHHHARAFASRGQPQLDTEMFEEIRELFRANWKPGAPVRLLGVHASSWAEAAGQMELAGEERREKWSGALAAADSLRDRFGESAVSLAASLRGKFRERVHENPAGLPGKEPDGRGRKPDSPR